MKLLAMRGISGSGKSTYVETLKNQGWAVVSRDAIRESVFKDYASVDEDAVTNIQDAMINALLKAGRNVVVDDTNIRIKYLKRFAGIAAKHNADFDVKQINCDVEEAIKRVKVRAMAGGRDVPESVIRKQAQGIKQSVKLDELYIPQWQPYVKPGGPKAILVDIDGTLAHNNGHRSFYEWDKVGDDEAVQVIVDLVKLLESEFYTIIMSGRDGSCELQTIEWLIKHGIVWDRLYMRAAGDQRKDSIVKMELFDRHIRDNYDIEFVLDDRNQVVEAWRSVGLTVLQVAEGNF